MVRQDPAGAWSVVALIDWETSGFYPEYWEAVKATNLLNPSDRYTWYKYIPDSISPKRYPIDWLVDRLWDQNSGNG